MSRRAEGSLARLAAGQWGLFTSAQAQQEGVNRAQLTRLVQAGVVERRTHGVYLISGAGADELIDLRAAWLHLDPARSAADRLGDGPLGAVVSHASAAGIFGFGDLDADRHEFTVPVRTQTRRTDVVLHRVALAAHDVVVRDGLPVTRPERTVVDLLATGRDGEHVAGVLASAVRARVIDVYDVARRIGRFAARYSCPAGDGDRLLDYLLRLGNALEDALGDLMAQRLRMTDPKTDRPLTQIDIARLADQVAVHLDLSAHDKESGPDRESSRSGTR